MQWLLDERGEQRQREVNEGTYYYRIDFASGRPTLTGFISLKR